jgi:sodium/potassium/calcium exchanger 6
LIFKFIIFHIILLRFISETIDEYVAPAITFISKWLNLSEALSAVTLLALANGAGDVITALVASGTDDAISYNIGSLYGAGLFCCTLVIAMTILKLIHIFNFLVLKKA